MVNAIISANAPELNVIDGLPVFPKVNGFFAPAVPVAVFSARLSFHSPPQTSVGFFPLAAQSAR